MIVHFELHDGRKVRNILPNMAIGCLTQRPHKVAHTVIEYDSNDGGAWSDHYSDPAKALAQLQRMIEKTEIADAPAYAFTKETEIAPCPVETPLLDEIKRAERVITETAGISAKEWQRLRGGGDPNEAMKRRDGLPFPRCPLPMPDPGESLRSYQLGRALDATFKQIDRSRWEQMK